MFGGLTSLFSGLAFAGLIYTINLQRRELQLQRKELRETRKELKRAADAQKEAVDAQKDLCQTYEMSAHVQALSALLDVSKDYENGKGLLFVMGDEGFVSKQVVAESARNALWRLIPKAEPRPESEPDQPSDLS